MTPPRTEQPAASKRPATAWDAAFAWALAHRWPLAFGGSGMVAVVALLLWVDPFWPGLVSNPTPTPTIWRWITHGGEALWWLSLLLPLALLAWKTKQWLWLRRDLALVATIAIAGLGVHPLKALAGRPRPKYAQSFGLEGFDFFRIGVEHASFPSGHSAVAGAVATMLCLLWPKGWPVWIACGLTVAISRVFLKVHFPSDCAAGLLFGSLVAYFVGFHTEVRPVNRLLGKRFMDH